MGPSLMHTAGSYVVRILVRNDADAHVTVRVDSESLKSAPTGINCLAGIWRNPKACFQSFPVLRSNIRPIQVQCDDFFWRKPHCKRGSGTVNPRVEQRIELELETEFLFSEFFHGDDFVTVRLCADGL